MTDLYTVLGLQRGASQADISRAFRRLALKYHPDRGGDPAVMATINVAYETLGSQERRLTYDQTGKIGAQQTVEGEALQALRNGLTQLLNGGFSGDPIGKAREIMHREQVAVKDKMAMHRVRVRGLNKQAKQVIAKQGENFISQIALDLAAQLTQQIGGFERALKVLAEQEKILKAFEWLGEEEVEVQHGEMFMSILHRK